MTAPTLQQFGPQYDGYKMRALVDDLTRAFQSIQTQIANIEPSSGGGGGVTVHNDLSGRSDADCHPISAITGLSSYLASLAPASAIITNHSALSGLSNDDHLQYIRVDGTRPFTGTQETQKLRPTVTNVYDLGDSTRKFRGLYSNYLHSYRLFSAGGGTGVANVIPTGTAIGLAVGANTAGNVGTIKSNAGAGYSSFVLGSALAAHFTKATTATVEASGRSSTAIGFSLTYGVNQHGVGSSAMVKATNFASLAIGAAILGPSTIPILASNNVVNAATVEALGVGASVFGVAKSIQGNGNYIGIDIRISAIGDGGFANGYVTSGFYSNVGGQIQAIGKGSQASGYSISGYVRATGRGSRSGGVATGNSQSIITATQDGADVFGFANNGILRAAAKGSRAWGYTGTYCGVYANGIGSFAGGKAYASVAYVYGVIQADGAGAVALGDATNGYIIARDAGSFAHGSTSLLGSIYAYAINAVQFGPGTNTQADSLKVGSAGIRFKGTAGAPGAPVNGDQWVSGGFVYVRSNAYNVKLATAPGWTTGAYAAFRNITTATALIGGLSTTGATSDFSIQAMTNVVPFGFANAAEGDTLVNCVLNLQTRTTELWRAFDTLTKDIRAANLLR